jgi:hypothetical protein
VSPPSPPTTPQQAPAASGDGAPAQAAPRPDYVPEAFWDGEKGAPKVEDAFRKLGELSALEKAHLDRKAAIPQKADEYEIAMPEGFKLPDGFEIDPENPAWASAREHALKAGWTKDEFKANAALYVQTQVAERQRLAKMEAEGLAKRDAALGPNAAQRVDALGVFFKTLANGDEKVAYQLSQTLFTPAIVSVWEKVQQVVANGGATPLIHVGGNGQSDPNAIPGYATMSFEQRRVAQMERAGTMRKAS